LNIVNLEQKEKVEGFIIITYTDGTTEKQQVDSFGISEEIPGYIVCWSDKKEVMVGLYNNDSIKKIEIL